MVILAVEHHARVVLYSQHERGQTLHREVARSFAVLMLESPSMAPDAVGRVMKGGHTIRTVDRQCRVWQGSRLVFTGEPPKPR